MLAGWKLTVPVRGVTGHAAALTPAAHTPPWLTDPGDGSLEFWAPVDGATTPNSRHARTELIHLDGFPAGRTRRTLAATVSVRQLPRGRPEVIIGQIHGDGPIRSVAFVMLRYAAGALTAVVKQDRSGPASSRFPVLTGVPLGDRFDYRITDGGDGTLTVDVAHAGRRGRAEAPLPAAFAGAPVRFQAGAYPQAVGPCGDPADGARVCFHRLQVLAQLGGR